MSVTATLKYQCDLGGDRWDFARSSYAISASQIVVVKCFEVNLISLLPPSLKLREIRRSCGSEQNCLIDEIACRVAPFGGGYWVDCRLPNIIHAADSPEPARAGKHSQMQDASLAHPLVAHEFQ